MYILQQRCHHILYEQARCMTVNPLQLLLVNQCEINSKNGFKLKVLLLFQATGRAAQLFSVYISINQHVLQQQKHSP